MLLLVLVRALMGENTICSAKLF